jgi:hypothetical protein
MISIHICFIHELLNKLFERIQYSTFNNNGIYYSSIRIYKSKLNQQYNIIKFVDISRTYFPLLDNVITSEVTIVFPQKTIRHIEYMADFTSTFIHHIENL